MIKFLNTWFNKDMLQSWFITWILGLSLVYSNEALFFDKHVGVVIIAAVCESTGGLVRPKTNGT